MHIFISRITKIFKAFEIRVLFVNNIQLIIWKMIIFRVTLTLCSSYCCYIWSSMMTSQDNTIHKDNRHFHQWFFERSKLTYKLINFMIIIITKSISLLSLGRKLFARITLINGIQHIWKINRRLNLSKS